MSEREERVPEVKIRTGPLLSMLSCVSILRMNSMASCNGLVSSSLYFTSMSQYASFTFIDSSQFFLFKEKDQSLKKNQKNMRRLADYHELIEFRVFGLIPTSHRSPLPRFELLANRRKPGCHLRRRSHLERERG